MKQTFGEYCGQGCEFWSFEPMPPKTFYECEKYGREKLYHDPKTGITKRCAQCVKESDNAEV